MELKERIDDLASFLDGQTMEITEYSETLVRRLIKKITVYDEKLTVEFKSGLAIDVDAQIETKGIQTVSGCPCFLVL